MAPGSAFAGHTSAPGPLTVPAGGVTVKMSSQSEGSTPGLPSATPPSGQAVASAVRGTWAVSAGRGNSPVPAVSVTFTTYLVFDVEHTWRAAPVEPSFHSNVYGA